jgi:hypothetical protein
MSREAERRVMVHKYERERGRKRLHRSTAELLRKYEAQAGSYEFVPAMMHLLKRYCEGVPEDKMNKLDMNIAKALDTIPLAKRLLKSAVEKYEGISNEIKHRTFSPRYLTWSIEEVISVQEMVGIIHRATTSQGQAAREEQECCCCCCEKPRESTTPPPTTSTPARPPTPPNEYEITFSHLYCVDESDPEWGGSDEPYVVFSVITEEMAGSGTSAWAFHTPVYEDVDDGDTRPTSGNENLRLFGYTGPKAINSSVLITAICMEEDWGNVDEITEGLKTALTATATVVASATGAPSWIVKGVSIIADGISVIIDLIGSDDQIGKSIALSLTEADADLKTSSVNPYIFPPLHFDGGDDDGIYDIYLKLRRK